MYVDFLVSKIHGIKNIGFYILDELNILGFVILYFCLRNLKFFRYITYNILNNIPESFTQVCGINQKIHLSDVEILILDLFLIFVFSSDRYKYKFKCKQLHT